MVPHGRMLARMTSFHMFLIVAGSILALCLFCCFCQRLAVRRRKRRAKRQTAPEGSDGSVRGLVQQKLSASHVPGGKVMSRMLTKSFTMSNLGVGALFGVAEKAAHTVVDGVAEGTEIVSGLVASAFEDERVELDREATAASEPSLSERGTRVDAPDRPPVRCSSPRVHSPGEPRKVQEARALRDALQRDG